MKDRNQPPIYAYPRLSKTDLMFLRIGGNGLGNLLMTWARCLSEAETRNWKVIWPTWRSFKPKNWRVNPHDHRTYADLFRPTDRYIHGWRKAFYLARCRHISEYVTSHSDVSANSVVMFRGMEGMFKPFLHAQALIKKELLAMASSQCVIADSPESSAPIAIHVRRGDFAERVNQTDTANRHNSTLPLNWYIDALKAVRACTGKPTPAIVISDGTDEELEALTTMDSVKRMDLGSSLADMLALSRGRLMIASGSTFSMWGTFLGQVPTIWHPGKHLQPLLLRNPELEFEWAPGDTMPDWIAKVGERINEEAEVE